jgi:Ca2+-dependent lipid-binding protein
MIYDVHGLNSSIK